MVKIFAKLSILNLGNCALQLAEFNNLSEAESIEFLEQCCSAAKWAQRVSASRPYDSQEELLKSAEITWAGMLEQDWLQAFDGHPQIGDPDSLKKKYQSTHGLASNEQSGVQLASDATIDALAAANQSYLDKFGFIFIICATGKSAEQMLQSINSRLGNSRPQELQNAAAEQFKITCIRINKLINS